MEMIFFGGGREGDMREANGDRDWEATPGFKQHFVIEKVNKTVHRNPGGFPSIIFILYSPSIVHGPVILYFHCDPDLVQNQSEGTFQRIETLRKRRDADNAQGGYTG